MTALQLSGCRVQLDLTSDRPQEAHHLAGYRGDNDGLGLACRRQPAITGAEPDLGLPGDVANVGYQRVTSR